ncbi:unnamed protein product [Sphagnum jensenii]|uniref:Uncharacterized protein n=1 Tax=Sphagnum jensenii TaxID=128206 RepID=A0ABP0W880_9BRYO
MIFRLMYLTHLEIACGDHGYLDANKLISIVLISFSDAYVNGPRATFLRPGNSGVPPFYSLDGDAGPTKENGVEVDSREIAVNVLEGLYEDLGQDAALARGQSKKRQNASAFSQETQQEEVCSRRGRYRSFELIVCLSNNSLVYVYANCGSVGDIWKAFNNIPAQDVIIGAP